MEALEVMLDKWSAICCILIVLVSVVQVPIVLLIVIFPNF